MRLAKVAVFGCLLATPGAAAAAFNVTQLTMTTGCGSNPPIISADGQRLAFGSGCTLAGAPANPVGDFFIVDIATAAFTPITNTQNCFNGALAMSADGQRLAFTSACDLTGTNTRQQSFLYAYDIAAGPLRQISTVPSCVLGSLTIDGDGSRIAFTTACHPTQASDSTSGIYLYDAGADAVTAAVPSSGCSAGFHMAPAISADGARIAFASNCDLLDNADNGSEIYVFDVATEMVRQITHTTGSCGAMRPTINADGTRIAFDAPCDGLKGFADNREIFIFDESSGIAQVTEEDGCQSAAARIDAAGLRVFFQSQCNLAGTGVNQRNFFWFDATAPGVFQEIVTPNCVDGNPSINADATRFAFSSTCNLTGDASGNAEL